MLEIRGSSLGYGAKENKRRQLKLKLYTDGHDWVKGKFQMFRLSILNRSGQVNSFVGSKHGVEVWAEEAGQSH
jgi:hypothetical protein